MSPRNKIIAAFISVVILFIVIKIAFPEPKRNLLQEESFWIAKTHGTTKYNIIVCGDSRIYRGFSIEDLKSAVDEKLTGINLGYSSAGFSNEYMDFALSKLDKHAQSQILVLGVTPHTLTPEAFKNWGVKRYKNLSPMEINKGLYFSPFLRHFEPYEVQELLKRKEVNYVQNFEPYGWVASSYLKPDTSVALASYKNTFSKYQVTDNEVNRFLQKMEEITSSGIKVIAFRPPTTNDMRMLEDSISGFDEAFIKAELISRNVIWMDFRDADFETYDGSHLHYKSAKELARKIGERINGL